ncbi:protein PLASTID MOVEMENT IMPAIRED 1 [Typha angustifolia]|uniref:protein PLASTID MOVEMENT IMPAIRED 1 n=1 Tax=Typha angustifolia TaxID=59011 RepID=UPI003C302967
MADNSGRRDSNTQILQELDALTHSLFQAHTARRTSLAIPPSAHDAAAGGQEASRSESRPRSRRMSMSPWRSRPKFEANDADDAAPKNQNPGVAVVGAAAAAGGGEKKGIWNWKPMRALSHIRMQRVGCLFSVEVVAIQRLPASMNGLRLAVAIRKKETKDGAVQTMPARVLQGSADFEETLFLRCHVYCTGGSAGKPLKIEPRPFLISAIAIDAPELDFGRSTVDLSLLVKDSMEKNLEGSRVRQWDSTFGLLGKAKGGELVLKLGFQIMEDGGVGIYNNQGESGKSSFKARKQSKTSFSVTSPRVTRSEPSSTPTKDLSTVDLRGIDDFSLDDTAADKKPEPEPDLKDDLEIPEFEVVDKGIEIQEEKGKDGEEEKEEKEGEVEEVKSVSSEVVKEVVTDGAQFNRLTELDAIAQQIKALESIMIGDNRDAVKQTFEGDEMQRLDAEEETVTKEFLQMLELDDGDQMFDEMPDRAYSQKSGGKAGFVSDTGIYISDLGKGLGPVVQTRDGGYLAAMNPFDVEVARKQTPKLAMQLSKPFILGDQRLSGGLELFQKLASVGSEELSSKLNALIAMDELLGKTAEQIAFEGMATAIIGGRSKEGASSMAAKSVTVLKTMAAAMSEGRRERIATGIWSVREEPVPAEDILALSLQKIEALALEALKVQADMADEQAPFDVSPLIGKLDTQHPLESTIPPEDWANSCITADAITFLVVIQLRDPFRRYETVGAPSIAIIQAGKVDDGGDGGEGRFKVASLHVGGLKLRPGLRRSFWDGEKQRLTAMQWLVAYGLGKAGKKSRAVQAKGGQEVLWSMSSRVMADMWLKAMRNPDVKFPDEQL